MATRTELLNKMAEERAVAEQAVKEHNELIIDGRIDEKVEEKLDKAIGNYTKYARQVAFIDCASSDNPMHTACIKLHFETIKAKEAPVEEDSKIKIKKIEPSFKIIDLKKLMKYCDGKLGDDPDWIWALEKFNLLMTAQKAKDLGLNPTAIHDSYAMADIAREYDLGKNPASKTNLLKTLTGIVQQMLGSEYKPVSHDVNYLLSIYSKKGRKALTVSCANHNHMRQYVQEICHRILTGGQYGVEFKAKKK